jgi:hypothetical protein
MARLVLMVHQAPPALLDPQVCGSKVIFIQFNIDTIFYYVLQDLLAHLVQLDQLDLPARPVAKTLDTLPHHPGNNRLYRN